MPLRYDSYVTRRRKYLIAAVPALLLILIVWNPWSTLLYRGDGEFSDELVFYPRYHIRFPAISLTQAAEHHFRLAGLPHEEVGLVLVVEDDQKQDREYLTHFPATIETKLMDSKGNVLCHAVGMPADDNKDGVWVVMTSPTKSEYWHYQCNFMKVNAFRSYDLMIRVSNIGNATQRLLVTPTLEGGGIELP